MVVRHHLAKTIEGYKTLRTDFRQKFLDGWMRLQGRWVKLQSEFGWFDPVALTVATFLFLAVMMPITKASASRPAPPPPVVSREYAATHGGGFTRFDHRAPGTVTATLIVPVNADNKLGDTGWDVYRDAAFKATAAWHQVHGTFESTEKVVAPIKGVRCHEITFTAQVGQD